jgi:hypothetical protein
MCGSAFVGYKSVQLEESVMAVTVFSAIYVILRQLLLRSKTPSRRAAQMTY